MKTRTPLAARSLSLGLTLALAVGLGACQIAGPPTIQDWLRREPALATVNPANIAVLQIEDKTSNGKLSSLLEPMRQQLLRALIERYYSPLGSTYVDAHMRRGAQEAATGGGSILDTDYLVSLAGKAKEDAILAIQISHWDDNSLLVDNRVHFAAKVVLLDSVGKKVLWSGGMQGEVEAGGGEAAPRDPAARQHAAAVEFITQLTERLPRRRA
jgi:hypothetical protein